MTSTTDFLTTIKARRRERLIADFGPLSGADQERLLCCATRPVKNFGGALAGAVVAVIAEVKRSSPSLGPIAPDTEASKQALVYQYGGASAISVLTEPEYFSGDFGDLSDVSDAVDVPVLCKDFVVDPMQLFLARSNGADAVLLMVSILGEELVDYLFIAETLGLQGLVEVHDLAELDLALQAGAALVGVNSRDLRDLSVDHERAREVVARARRDGFTVVAESGIQDRGDVERAAEAGADAVLVGEALMRARFPEDVLEGLTGVAKTSPVARD